jgi:hypothetical protein
MSRLWSEIPHKYQYKVLKFLEELAALEDNLSEKEALVAARKELNMWSTVPVDYIEEYDESYLIARAVPQYDE